MRINRFSPIRFSTIPVTLLLLTTLIPTDAWNSSLIKVGVSPYNPPFSFTEDGETVPTGFCSDLARLLASNIGLTAEIYTIDDMDLIRSLRNGSVDMVIGLVDDTYLTKDISFIETTITDIEKKIYVNQGLLTITSYKDLTGRTVSVEKGIDLTWILPSDMNINYIRTETTGEALALVNSGKADAYISNNINSTIYSLQKYGFQNIKEVGAPLKSVPMVIAVKKSNAELLTSIRLTYEKALEDRSYYSIFYKWFGKDFRYYTTHYIKFILSVVGVSILASLVFLFWNHILKSKVVLITNDLKRSEKKYRDLIESSPDMIHLISPSGEIKLANNIALKHLEYEKKEMETLRLHDLILPEQTDEMTAFIERSFRDDYSSKEFTFMAKSGRSIQVEMVATIVKEVDSVEKLACCFSRDLTERKRLEENLLYSDRLATMGQMAAGIAHEINNPLGIILANTQDALYHSLNPEDSMECLRSIERNAVRAAEIIEEMLNFTRPAPLQLNPVDLPQLVNDSLFFLKQKLKQKNIMIEKNFPANLAGLNGDENLIQQLLINIILNSVQAIRNDGVIKITINEIGDNGNTRIKLEIEDNGIGIPEEDLKNIFDPFFTSRKEKGFGMGLFISKIIIEKHHGLLTVRSKPGEGTSMTMEFPSESARPPETLKIC